MYSDLDVIVKVFPNTKEWNTIRIYAIGDCHVGSEQFDTAAETALKKKIQIIHDDPYGVVTLCGDLGDFGLRGSVTNPLRATETPAQQIDHIYEMFEPIADKIVSAVPGNHEQRLTKETGIDPLLSLTCRWHCENVYRENVAILKLLFGIRSNKTLASKKPQQNTFVGITTHGSSKNKNHKFNLCFDGIDWAVSGHCHQPSYSPHGKIRVNGHAGTAKHVAYKEIVVDANLTPGSYSLKKEYEIAPPPEIQYLEMYIKRGPAPDRTESKIINYHSIQL